MRWTDGKDQNRRHHRTECSRRAAVSDGLESIFAGFFLVQLAICDGIRAREREKGGSHWVARDLARGIRSQPSAGSTSLGLK